MKGLTYDPSNNVYSVERTKILTYPIMPDFNVDLVKLRADQIMLKSPADIDCKLSLNQRVYSVSIIYIMIDDDDDVLFFYSFFLKLHA